MDIVNTYRVLPPNEFFRGKYTPIQFQFSEQKLTEFIKARADAKPHLVGMVGLLAGRLKTVDSKVLHSASLSEL